MNWLDITPRMAITGIVKMGYNIRRRYNDSMRNARVTWAEIKSEAERSAEG